MLYKTNYFKTLENENYNSIDETREKIDKIDLEILDLILKCMICNCGC